MWGAAVVGKAKADELRKKQLGGGGAGAIQFGVLVTGAPKEQPAGPPPAAGTVRRFSEARAIATLQAEPNAWDIVLAAETQRPEYETQGARPKVAAALLEAAGLAKAKPMPGPVMEQLRVMAK